jgi:hypothetical protein
MLVFATACALLAAAGASASQSARAANHHNTVLFLASSLDPADGPTFADSIEVAEAVAKGYSVEIDSDVEWAAKSAADFAGYRAIVIGDAQDGSNNPMPALLGNLSKWTSAIRGNEFLTGADPEYHARNGNNTPPSNPALSIQRGVDYAVAKGTTGLYFAFGGYDASDIQTVLNDLGSGFTVVIGGADNVHVVANVPGLTDLTDAVLSGWHSTYHKTITAIPNGFTVFATQNGNASNFAWVIRQGGNPPNTGPSNTGPCTPAPGGCYEQLPKAGYCSVAGNVDPYTAAPTPPGTFLNLLLGQPVWDPAYMGAIPATYYEGIGITCNPPPLGYKDTGTKVDNSGTSYPGDTGAIYEYWRHG